MLRKSNLTPILLLAVICLLGFATSVSAYVGYETLDIPTQKQQDTQWCWAANSVMVIDFLGNAPTQRQFVRYVKGEVVNDTGSIYEIVDGLDHWGIHSRAVLDYLSFSRIENRINRGQPIIARIGWTGGGGHFFTIRGYYENTDTDEQDVYFIDSLKDEKTHKIQNYDRFVRNSNFKWTHSVDYIYVN